MGVGALSFSRDGTRLLATVNRGFAHESVILIDVPTATATSLFAVSLWSPRPVFAADGCAVFYCSDSSGVGNVYRRSLVKDAAPQAITQFASFVSEAQLTPDERTLVFRRNRALFAVAITVNGANEREVRELSPEGGDAFALTPDGTSVIYAAGPRLWIQSLDAKTRRELIVRLEWPSVEPPTMLIERVRLLDFDTGTFNPRLHCCSRAAASDSPARPLT